MQIYNGITNFESSLYNKSIQEIFDTAYITFYFPYEKVVKQIHPTINKFNCKIELLNDSKIAIVPCFIKSMLIPTPEIEQWFNKELKPAILVKYPDNKLFELVLEDAKENLQNSLDYENKRISNMQDQINTINRLIQ